MGVNIDKVLAQVGFGEYSLAGINWTERTAPGEFCSSVCWSPELGLFVAVGTIGVPHDTAMTSPDGTNWTVITVPAGEWSSVCWSSELSLFVAVAQLTANQVMTSPDGINWTVRAAPGADVWQSVCWSPGLGLFVAVGRSGSPNQVMTSPDGIVWAAQVAPVDEWYTVCWSPELGLFVAVGDGDFAGNFVMTSPDGINWVVRAPAAPNQWMGVCWSPILGLFVAVARTGVGNRVMTSPDGINWTIRASAADDHWMAVCWAPEVELFVAVGAGLAPDGWVMTSIDGINWASRAATAYTLCAWHSVCWSAELGIFVATALAGLGELVMTSGSDLDLYSRLYDVITSKVLRSRLTVARATYLDNINNPDLANIIRDIAEATGTFAYDETNAAEQTAFTLAIAARAKIGGIWLDLVNVTQDTTIRVKHQIDGANYRTFQTGSWTILDDDGILITGFTAYRNVQVSLQCGGGGAGPVNVLYAVV